jgi:hypothetical protein
VTFGAEREGPSAEHDAAHAAAIAVAPIASHRFTPRTRIDVLSPDVLT